MNWRTYTAQAWWRLRGAGGVSLILILINVIVYVLQVVLDGLTRGLFSSVFGLSMAGLRNGWLWQLVTYMFLHDPHMPLHLLVNMAVLYFMGPETERGMGTRNFLMVYFLSGILGGLGWILIGSVGLCVGASGAIFGILGAFATMYPNRYITLLLFFILPVTMKAWVLVVGMSIVELALLVGREGRIANSVHLGGMIVGVIFAWVVVRRGLSVGLGSAWRRSRLRVVQTKNTADTAEVDRILEKIAEQGMGSLTKKERAMLEKASRR